MEAVIKQVRIGACVRNLVCRGDAVNLLVNADGFIFGRKA
jgi:hypothetical protein